MIFSKNVGEFFMVQLREHQKKALEQMKNGCILCGGVGSGKSITSISYYFLLAGGSIEPFRFPKVMKDLYIITTARKRDTFEWDDELVHFGLCREGQNFNNKVVIDSWNNLHHYVKHNKTGWHPLVKNAYFIFDEQRVIGTGTWVKSFLALTKVNEWILLSATPGDTWLDYIPVFIANGFYKNFTDFRLQHVIYSPFTKFRKVERYVNVAKLERLRNDILVDMPFERQTTQHHRDIIVDYDRTKYDKLMRFRRDLETDIPFKNAAELCSALRKVCNLSPEKFNIILDIIETKKKVIIFYNFNYELDALCELFNKMDITYAQWNGHKHEEIPETDEWVYIVQYSAGNEGWNCIKTDTIIFFSQNYSYKVMVQAAGRIDRLTTPFTDLWYYHFKTQSGIDRGISRAIKTKKKFNEDKHYGYLFPKNKEER